MQVICFRGFQDRVDNFINPMELMGSILDDMCSDYRDRCVVRLKRERANCMVEVATFVWSSGGVCIHSAEWLLLALNIVILLHYLFFISLYCIPCFIFHNKNYPQHLNE